jgi:hypothetical protein
MVAMGLFYTREVIIVNSAIGSVGVVFYLYFFDPVFSYYILQIIVVVIFNIMDIRKINSTEMATFFKIIKNNKESTYLSKFVDRLLPKHVTRIYQDSRNQSSR